MSCGNFFSMFSTDHINKCKFGSCIVSHILLLPTYIFQDAQRGRKVQGPHQVGKSGKSREFCDRSGKCREKRNAFKNVVVSVKSLIVVPWSKP